MATQRNDMVTTQFNFIPTTLKEAQEYATIFANSGLCPEGYRGRPNDILIVWQMGKELGLDKMQALRTLGCINGMPFAYGDGLLALIKKNQNFVDMKEWFEGSLQDRDLTAFCTMIRKNKEPVTQKFSMEDAKIAGLWGKKGPWLQYPKRMLQHRARGFAAKDVFPDALFGLMSEEEAHSVSDSKIVISVPKIKSKGIAGLEESLGIIEGEFETAPEVTIEKIRHNELIELISHHKVKDATIKAYLKRCNVSHIQDLTDDQVEKWSNHLKSKEQNNEI